MEFYQSKYQHQNAGVMAKICLILSTLAVLPAALAQTEQCVSLATSTTCAAFNASSISTDTFMVGLFPFLQGVTDAASFDRNLTAYVQDGFVNLKYQTLFGCSGINLDNTTNLYARFTTTVICNGVVQNSVDRCGLTAADSAPVCADTCAQYALSEQRIVADSDLCRSPSNYTNTQLRADYTNCGLPPNALTGSACIEGITNEPTNCGFGYATIGLCQYCSEGGENPTDPCCSRAQASTRCANVVLPSISVSASAFLTATASSTQGSSSATASPSSSSSASSAGTGAMNSENHRRLSTGAIAGIAVGGVVGLALLIGLVVLLACCCRRRRNSSAAAATQRKEKTPAAPAMVYNPHDSSLSSLGRAPSEYEVLPGGRQARKSALPSEYSVPPFAAVMPSSTSEYGGDNATSSRQPRMFSSRAFADNNPGGFYTLPKGDASVVDEDFVVLPGGRRARMSTSIAGSRPASPTPEDNADVPSRSQATAAAVQHSRKKSSPKLDTPLPLPAEGSAPSKMDDYEVLPGGRVARKSGLTGHVGGVTVLKDQQEKDNSSTDSSQSASISAAQPQSVGSENRTSTSAAAPISTTRGPTMPPNSSIKDYYSPAQIQTGGRVTAVWSYAARTHDEFALERGDVLQITSIWGDGWAIGYLVKQGIDSSSDSSEAASKQTDEATTPENTGAIGKEVKAFPLVCVCASEYWDRVIEAGGKPLSSATFDLI